MLGSMQNITYLALRRSQPSAEAPREGPPGGTFLCHHFSFFCFCFDSESESEDLLTTGYLV